MEIVPGIHQLQVPIPNNPLAGLNAYLIQGEEGWLLVDAGWDCDEAFNALERQLGEKGLGFDAISQIIITHAHPDHYGLMGRITRCSGARSALHQADCALIEAVAQDRVGRAKRHADQLKANGVPEEELRTLAGAFVAAANTVRYLDQPDVVLHGGEKISTGVFDLEVIFTPGHCPGHICLYECNRKILFSGDHILPKITPHVNMVPYYADNPLAIFIDSLKKVDQLDADLVFPAHEHVFEDLHGRISEIISHHEVRLEHALEAIRHESKTAYEIASEMPWISDVETGEETTFADLDASGRAMAAGETWAHLEYLRFEGRVEKESRDDLIFYRA